MARHKFTHDVEADGITFGNGVDFEIEVEALLDAGQPDFDVTEVWLDGVDLLASKSTICKMIGCAIAEAAAASEYIQERALEDAGLMWTGRTGNDPDSEWRARA